MKVEMIKASEVRFGDVIVLTDHTDGVKEKLPTVTDQWHQGNGFTSANLTFPNANLDRSDYTRNTIWGPEAKVLVVR